MGVHFILLFCVIRFSNLTAVMLENNLQSKKSTTDLILCRSSTYRICLNCLTTNQWGCKHTSIEEKMTCLERQPNQTQKSLFSLLPTEQMRSPPPPKFHTFQSDFTYKYSFYKSRNIRILRIYINKTNLDFIFRVVEPTHEAGIQLLQFIYYVKIYGAYFIHIHISARVCHGFQKQIAKRLFQVVPLS